MKRELIIELAIAKITNYMLGELENELLNNPNNEEVKNLLKNKKFLKDSVYKELLNNPRVEVGAYIINVTKDIRFLGKQKIMQLIENQL